MTRKPDSSNAMNRQRARDELLLAILPHVIFDGWTDAAFRAGAADCGMEPIAVRRYFPGGARELISHFSDWADRQMMMSYRDRDTGDMRLRDKIALAVRLRLEALGPHREAVRRTLSVLALPTNTMLAARSLYRTVDAMWHEVGDRSADFNFYSKRALLAAVVSSTTLYWLDDDSDGCASSWSFLDRRIVDVMKIPNISHRLSQVAERLPDPFRILRAVRDRRPA